MRPSLDLAAACRRVYLSRPLASPLPFPGWEETSGEGAEAVVAELAVVSVPDEASIPRSLACAAAAAEEELPGVGAGSGFGTDVVGSGFGADGWGVG